MRKLAVVAGLLLVGACQMTPEQEAIFWQNYRPAPIPQYQAPDYDPCPSGCGVVNPGYRGPVLTPNGTVWLR